MKTLVASFVNVSQDQEGQEEDEIFSVPRVRLTARRDPRWSSRPSQSHDETRSGEPVRCFCRMPDSEIPPRKLVLPDIGSLLTLKS